MSEIDQPPIEQPAEIVQPQPAEAPAIERFPAWSGRDFLLLTLAIGVLLLVVIVVGSLLVVIKPSLLGQKMNLAIQYTFYLAGILLMQRMVHHHGLSLMKAIKWNWPGQNAILYPALGIGVAVVTLSLQALLKNFMPKNVPIEQMIKSSTPTDLWLLAIFGVMIAPVFEEFYFRGFMYPTAARASGVVLGASITIFTFVAIHGPQLAFSWVPLVMLTAVSATFTIIRIYTNSVSAAVLAHSGYNATLFLIMFLQTSGFRNLEKLSQ